MQRFIERLNLGAGCQPQVGFWNVDCFAGPSIDEVVDLNGPWPWEDGSVYFIHTSHCVEHLKDVTHFMREAHRVLCPGGSMEIRVPHGWNTAAWGDPTHVRPMFPETFGAFCDGYGTDKSFNLQHDTVRWNFNFELVRTDIIPQPWVMKLPFWRKLMWPMSNVILNVIREIRVYIRKKQ